MEYLIRFVQMHTSFRQAEIEALAELYGLHLTWLSYCEDSPFAIIRFDGALDPGNAAKCLISRSILTSAIYELWGEASDYARLHDDVRSRTQHTWDRYAQESFKFELDSFQATRALSEQRDIIETFSYMDFGGPIVMKTPQHHFVIFEESVLNGKTPRRLYLGRLVAESGRKAAVTYNLKKRNYIATTSMDAELSLVTANMALARPGALAYDPFMGTGSFPVACAHFGATVFGSDMDGRSIRGKNGRSVKSNFEQYSTSSLYLDGFAADITNTPFRQSRCLDAIVCDPPYGVREGLKVLGSSKEALKNEVWLADGTLAHLKPDYVPPRKPYSFLRMLDDILDFAGNTLADGGRLCMWVPVAGAVDDADVARPEDDSNAQNSQSQTEIDIPDHPALALVSTCTQEFRKWSRRLLTYRRRPDNDIDQPGLLEYQMRQSALRNTSADEQRMTADDLNLFRRKYFQGFRESG